MFFSIGKSSRRTNRQTFGEGIWTIGLKARLYTRSGHLYYMHGVNRLLLIHERVFASLPVAAVVVMRYSSGSVSKNHTHYWRQTQYLIDTEEKDPVR